MKLSIELDYDFADAITIKSLTETLDLFKDSLATMTETEGTLPDGYLPFFSYEYEEELEVLQKYVDALELIVGYYT